MKTTTTLGRYTACLRVNDYIVVSEDVTRKEGVGVNSGSIVDDFDDMNVIWKWRGTANDGKERHYHENDVLMLFSCDLDNAGVTRRVKTQKKALTELCE